MAKPNGKHCVVCGKGLTGQQGKCCSRACLAILNSERTKGVKRSDKTRRKQSKSAKAALERDPSIIERRKRTNLERFGVEVPSQCDEIKKKIEDTNFQKYGVKAPSQCDKVKKKIEDTNLQKYGVRSTLQHHGTQEKIKQTMLDRYDVEHALQSEEIISRQKQTMLDRYGVEHASQSDEMLSRMKKTSIERYGVPNIKQKSLDPIWEQLNDQEWWNKFNTFQDVEDFLKDYLSLSPIYYYTGRYRKDLIGQGVLISKPHQKVVDFLKNLGISFETNTREVIKPQELDIFIPAHNLAIEINGIYWHSELVGGKGKKYHLKKTEDCEKQGITLLQFWDTEIDSKLDIVQSMISSRLGISKTKVGARQCKMVNVSSKDASEFFEMNHIQGSSQSTFVKGLLHDGELIACMSMVKSRFTKKFEYELARFATKLNTSVQGGFSKLLKAFDITCISYSDRRYSNGKVYQKCGFSSLSVNPPAYRYIGRNGNLESRMKYQKNRLSKLLEHFDPSLTEWENMYHNGFDRVWDCGTESWVYTK